jgi:hypothetical protein
MDSDFQGFKYCPNYNVIIALNKAKILERRFESNMEYLCCCKSIKNCYNSLFKEQIKTHQGA